jgi:hypothetical protein
MGELVREMTEMSAQESVTLVLGVLLLVYWVQRWTRPWWAARLSAWLLKRGQVRMAMRLRFGKRCH